MRNTPDQLCRAALATLIVLQAVMLAALFTQTPPHPPIAVAPFALGPFLGGSLAVACASFFLGSTTTRGGRATALLAGVLALVSFGPQKWGIISKSNIPDHFLSGFGLPGAAGLKNALRKSCSDISGISYSRSISAFVGW